MKKMMDGSYYHADREKVEAALKAEFAEAERLERQFTDKKAAA